MLLYLIEHRSEPFHWRDVEALPLYLFGLLVLAGVARIAWDQPPEVQAGLAKVVAIAALVTLRYLVLGRADDGRGAAGTAPA